MHPQPDLLILRPDEGVLQEDPEVCQIPGQSRGPELSYKHRRVRHTQL